MVILCNGHSILIMLIHIAWSTNIRGREDNLTSDGVEVKVVVVV
jgi:hypothetical protein